MSAERREALVKKLLVAGGYEDANVWHSALVELLASVILDNAKDLTAAVGIIFQTKEDIEKLVLKNWVDKEDRKARTNETI